MHWHRLEANSTESHIGATLRAPWDDLPRMSLAIMHSSIEDGGNYRANRQSSTSTKQGSDTKLCQRNPLCNLLHIPQTARSLRIAHITRTLICRNTGFNVSNHRCPRLWRSPLDVAYPMLKTVAYQHIWTVWLFLIHPLTDLVYSQRLTVIGGKIDHRTML